MPKQRSVFVLLFLIVAGCHREPARYVSPDITARELQQHVAYLASDELEGRASGTRGNELAARYIADQFGSYGLNPAGDNGTWFQSFQVLSKVEADDQNNMKISAGKRSSSLALKTEFIPLSYSADTAVTAGVVFVGYGIAADTLNYNDYANVDVSGKIAVILRYSPDYGKPDSKFYDYAPLYRKVFTAREKGAAGVILVTGPADEEKPSLVPLRAERGLSSSGIAAVSTTAPIVDSLLRWSGSKKNLRALQQSIYDTKAPESFEVRGVTVAMRTHITKIYASTANVVGYLEGNDPQLKNETIVLGAHFDHLGLGGPGSGSLQPDTVAIHNGADDNASGTSALMEIAQALSAERGILKRSYVFIAFTGEEMGLLGSAHYVKNPAVPLERTTAMFNLDMVGRLRDSALTVEGIGTSPLWKPLLEKENELFHFRLKLGQGGTGPSDHASFYAKDIPVLFFFTGLHDDYHRPSDDWDKINYEGERQVAQFAFQVANDLDAAEKPAFVRVQTSASDSASRRGFRVTFGIVPDYSEDENGLKISGTRPASPAEKAGLKGGDVITKFRGKDIKSIYDLTYVLGECRPGDEVDVEFKRGGEVKSAKVKLEARQ